MKISIVIPVLNEELYLPELIKNLNLQTYPIWEVIVIDGGSTDYSLLIKDNKLNIKYIKASRGISNQRNVGGNNASGEIIVFMDADVYPDPDFISNVITKFNNHKLKIACPYFLAYKSTWPTSLLHHFFNLLHSLAQYKYPTGAGCCIIIRKDVWLNSPGFNTDLKVIEDVEFIRVVAKKNLFRMINVRLYISDRRFRKYGFFNQLRVYLNLSLRVLTHNLKSDKGIEAKYRFGRFQKKK